MVSRGKRYARKDSEGANDTASGRVSSSVASWTPDQAANAKRELTEAQCDHCESPCASEELELTDCCSTQLCSVCYELQVVENAQCPACQGKLPKSRDYKRHFVDESDNIELSHTMAVDASSSNYPGMSKVNGLEAQVSPTGLKMPLNSFSESAGSDPWDDEEKANEARQTLQAATTHLIETYNAMAEFLGEDERNRIIEAVVKSSGVTPNMDSIPVVATQSNTFVADVSILPASYPNLDRACTPPLNEQHPQSGTKGAATAPSIDQTRSDKEKCMSCALLRSRIQAAKGLLEED